jgi:hypothetical protein
LLVPSPRRTVEFAEKVHAILPMLQQPRNGRFSAARFSGASNYDSRSNSIEDLPPDPDAPELVEAADLWLVRLSDSVIDRPGCP